MNVILIKEFNYFLRLARVYIQTVADVKRTILRVVEHPVRAMGMDSPELLKLVEECPKGSETLVTRLIHILTDKCKFHCLCLQLVNNYNSRLKRSDCI